MSEQVVRSEVHSDVKIQWLEGDKESKPDMAKLETLNSIAALSHSYVQVMAKEQGVSDQFKCEPVDYEGNPEDLYPYELVDLIDEMKQFLKLVS